MDSFKYLKINGKSAKKNRYSYRKNFLLNHSSLHINHCPKINLNKDLLKKRKFLLGQQNFRDLQTFDRPARPEKNNNRRNPLYERDFISKRQRINLEKASNPLYSWEYRRKLKTNWKDYFKPS